MANASPAQIQKSLNGVDYPASKSDLIKHANNNKDKNEEVMNVLNQLPDKHYNSPIDVTKEVGKIE